MSLKAGYQEWLNCGNKGTILEYVKKVGIILEEKEEKKDVK